MKNKEKNEEPKSPEPQPPEILMQRHVLGEIASGYLFGTVTAVCLMLWTLAIAGLNTAL